MKLSFLAILLLVTSFCYPQTFEKYYRTDQDDIIFDAILLENGDIVFVISSGDYSTQDYEKKLFRLNQYNGKFIDSTEIVFDYPSYRLEGYTKLKLLGDSSILILGQSVNKTTDDLQLFIARYDLDFNSLFDTVVGNLTLNEGIGDIKVSSDSILVIAGWENFGELLLEERKISGEFIRKETYTGGGMLASTVMDLPNTNKYHLYRWADGYHGFYIIDKGDLSVDTIIQYPLGFQPRNAVNGLDSGYYYVAGDKLSINPPEENNLSFIKVSNDGFVLQEFEYDTDSLAFYSTNSFNYNPDFIYFGGSYPLTWIPPPFFYPEPRWILIYKLTHNGEIAWQKFYKGDVNYMPYKVLATNDGGALIFSSFYDWDNPIPNQRDVHILKIDSLGYYTPLTSTPKELEQMTKQILVYPNPVENEVNFVFGLYKDLEINIYDMLGNKVFSDTFAHSAKIDVSHFKPGVYPYVISGKKGFYEEGKLIKE